MTTANLRGLQRDEGKGLGVESPPACSVPRWMPRETSRKRCAEDAGHEADDAGHGGAQPDPGVMVGDSMSELRPGAEALGADVVALVEAYAL